MNKEDIMLSAKALAEKERSTFKGSMGCLPSMVAGILQASCMLMGTPISLRVLHNLSRSCAVSGSDSRLSGFLELIREQVLEHGLDPFCNFINLDDTQIVLYPTQKQVAVVFGIKRLSK